MFPVTASLATDGKKKNWTWIECQQKSPQNYYRYRSLVKFDSYVHNYTGNLYMGKAGGSVSNDLSTELTNITTISSTPFHFICVMYTITTLHERAMN